LGQTLKIKNALSNGFLHPNTNVWNIASARRARAKARAVEAGNNAEKKKGREKERREEYGPSGVEKGFFKK
jgi:hypothetical protein